MEPFLGFLAVTTGAAVWFFVAAVRNRKESDQRQLLLGEEKGTVTQLRDENGRLASEAIKAHEALGVAKEDCQKAVAELNATSEDVAALLADKATLEAESERLLKERDDLHDRLLNAQEAHEIVLRERAGLHAELNALRGERREARESAEKMAQDLNRWKVQYANIEALWQQGKGDLAIAQRHIDASGNHLLEARKERDAAQFNAETMQQANDKLSDALKVRAEVLARLEKERDDMTRARNALMSQRDRLTVALAGLRDNTVSAISSVLEKV